MPVVQRGFFSFRRVRKTDNFPSNLCNAKKHLLLKVATYSAKCAQCESNINKNNAKKSFLLSFPKTRLFSLFSAFRSKIHFFKNHTVYFCYKPNFLFYKIRPSGRFFPTSSFCFFAPSAETKRIKRTGRKAAGRREEHLEPLLFLYPRPGTGNVAWETGREKKMVYDIP